MKLYYNQLIPVAYTASSESSGYEGNRVGNYHIRDQWRTSGSPGCTLVIDLGSALTPTSLFVNDTNISSMAVSYSTDGVSYTSAGTLLTTADKKGRRKGVLPLTFTDRYVKLTVSSGSPSEGYWYIGAVFLFTQSTTLAVQPKYGLEVTTVFPGVSNDLANGRRVLARTGPEFTRVTGVFEHLPSVSGFELISTLRSYGLALIDVEDSNNPTWQWVGEFLGEDAKETAASVGYYETGFSFDEVV